MPAGLQGDVAAAIGKRVPWVGVVEMTRTRRTRLSGLVAAVLTALAWTQSAAAQSLSAPELRAGYLFKFAQFIEWPAEAAPPGTTLSLCIVNDERVADALDRTIKDRTVDGHTLTVRRLKPGTPLPACHVLYLAGADTKRSLDVVETVKGAFVLTVSDATRFAESGGMVELFVENGHMRFAVNIDALQRARIRLSSRVLTLAKIVKDAKPQ